MSRGLFNMISNIENTKRKESILALVILSSISNKNVIFLPLGGKVRMRGELEQVKLDFLPLDVEQLIPSPWGEG